MKFSILDLNFRRIAQEAEEVFYIDYLPIDLLTPIEQDQDDSVIDSLAYDFVEARGWPDTVPPISVTLDEDVGGYVILNGHHRWRAAKKVGLDEIPCRIFKDDPSFVQWYLD